MKLRRLPATGMIALALVVLLAGFTTKGCSEVKSLATGRAVNSWSGLGPAPAARTDGVWVRTSNRIAKGYRIAKWTFYGAAAVAGVAFADYIFRQIQAKDPCLNSPPSYKVAQFHTKDSRVDPYLDCGTLYPMMKSGEPYNQLSFNISCINMILDHGKFTLQPPDSERWQYTRLHVVAAVPGGRIKRYKCT